MPNNEPAAFSAPGKSLFVGGYLVLFPQYSALSLGLSSRMHAVASTEDKNERGLIIKSPQFCSEWTYPSTEGASKNPFLEACYEVTREYFGEEIDGTVTIWSDSGFHSQSGAKQNHFPGKLGRFSYYGRAINEVPKTGLGSSAALVVTVVAAISHLATNSLGISPLDSRQIHNLSQIAHCVAQKKVGSGFDVATATYGSILYSRFSPEAIPSQLDQKSLHNAVDETWNMQLKPCSLPSNVSLLMGDVSQGSETPGMVKQVLKWKDENPEASSQLFEQLNQANMEVAEALNVQEGNFERIQNAIRNTRGHLQKLTSLTGVPIEPKRQTGILDRASSIEGVLGGVVPGAGGDDAICVLIEKGNDQILPELEKIEGVEWISYDLEQTGLQVEPLANYQ